MEGERKRTAGGAVELRKGVQCVSGQLELLRGVERGEGEKAGCPVPPEDGKGRS